MGDDGASRRHDEIEPWIRAFCNLPQRSLGFAHAFALEPKTLSEESAKRFSGRA